MRLLAKSPTALFLHYGGESIKMFKIVHLQTGHGELLESDKDADHSLNPCL